MVYGNRVKPLTQSSSSPEAKCSVSSLTGVPEFRDRKGSAVNKEANDLDSLSTVAFEESSYLKLKPFSQLDPTLVRLLTFFNCFGLLVNFGNYRVGKKGSSGLDSLSMYCKILLMVFITVVSGEVVYDVNLRQSKLLAEQKRSTPLLTFVIVAYSWLALVIPIFCDVSLILVGSSLFRFYSRTTATVCNGNFFGKKTFIDTWYYYFLLVLIAFVDAASQVVVLGIWPKSIDPYFKMLIKQDAGQQAHSAALLMSASSPISGHNSNNNNNNHTVTTTWMTGAPPDAGSDSGSFIETLHEPIRAPKINAHLLDMMLGKENAHSDLGICLKILCLMIQFIHSYSFFMLIIAWSNHYATAINNINDSLDKYEFRKLLKQLIILRDSSEQISLMISLPFAFVIILVFMRLIAVNGVIIQSTMLPFENWAVSLQSFTCSLSMMAVFINCDGLQSASKQTHRLKSEQTVTENRSSDQSIYELLDYLNRLSKSIRVTFFNIIAINKSSLVSLFGHILTLTFVTS